MRRVVLITLCLIVNFVAYGKLYDPETLENKDYEVLALSAAIIDHHFFITNEQLKLITNEKGGWAPIDYATLASILDKNESISKMTPGGSAANVIKGLTRLGEKCALIGKIGDDEKGEYYLKKLRDYGIIPFLKKGSLPTGQAICLITPDGQKTFRTYLGASHSLTDLNFDKELLHDKMTLFHIEGFQIVDRDLVIRALKMVKEAQLIISLDLGNVEIVRQNKEFIYDILEDYVDIVFCNEREAKALTGLKACESCDRLAKLCDIAVVTMSERGSWVRKGNEKIYMEAFSVKSIDSTGAGNLYESGFLHGYLNGYSLKKCAWIGSLLASYVVKRIGAEIPNSVWEEIREIISNETKTFDKSKNLILVESVD